MPNTQNTFAVRNGQALNTDAMVLPGERKAGVVATDSVGRVLTNRDAIASSAATLTLDLNTGPVFDITLAANVTTLAFTNPPASGEAYFIKMILRQDATGSRTLAWPASVLFAGGTDLVISTTANAIDVVELFTVDGGTSWFVTNSRLALA